MSGTNLNLSHNKGNPQRKTSIVDMLSTPPALAGSSPSDHDTMPTSTTSTAASTTSTSTSTAPAPGDVPVSLSRNASVSSSVISTSEGSTAPPRDWQDIPLSELVEENKLIFVNGSISMEEAFKTLISHNLTSLPVEEFDNDINCITFDYGDLNTFLLLVLHKISFDLSAVEFDPHFALERQPLEYLNDIKMGKQAPIKFVCQLTSKNPFIKLNEKLDTLSSVVEILGSGVHRVAIINNENKISGILSQRRLIRYLWDNARRFPSLDSLLQTPLDELEIGSTSNVIFVYGDQPLIDALVLMYNDQISSVAVVDRQQNLLGNISITDVKHVSKSSQSHLLHKSCLHFVSIILNSRGLEDGQDSFPIFHVFPNSSLGRIIAKLVATKAHRLWIVSPRPTNSFSSPSKPPLSSSDSESSTLSSASTIQSIQNPAFLNLKPEMSGRAGKLIGVVSLTDILGLLARKSSNKTIDPHAARKQRRRSSSSASSRSAKSLEQLRRSVKSDGRQ
ncbi:Sds23 protein [Saccharomycopsis crataegensis]|uniref:Sds23 protein n=1 Tax=Saccharomycopsis crataegensis TaxID=43959 RepID=A0AAV5QLB4_9ASCO|nr:Sds23 protein [Saccharomycopsis crataegensis]